MRERTRTRRERRLALVVSVLAGVAVFLLATQLFPYATIFMIAVPSGVQIFCWIATLWAGRPRVRVPLLFVLGFVVVFVAAAIPQFDPANLNNIPVDPDALYATLLQWLERI